MGGIANFIEQFETIRDFIKYISQICKIRFTDFVKYDYPFPFPPDRQIYPRRTFCQG